MKTNTETMLGELCSVPFFFSFLPGSYQCQVSMLVDASEALHTKLYTFVADNNRTAEHSTFVRTFLPTNNGA
jgi:hypothetical protein